MSLLTKIYKKLKEKQSENLKIELTSNQNVCELEIILFPTNSYRFERVSASDLMNSVGYLSLAYNSFDTFLDLKKHYKHYEKYFKLKPLKTWKEEIEKIKTEGDLEREKNKSNYTRMIFLNSEGLTSKEMKSALNFFIDIFQEKLKNPQNFCWYKFITSSSSQMSSQSSQ